MLQYFLLFIIMLSPINASTIYLDSKTDLYDVLQSSEIYIDKSKLLKIDDITAIDNQFESNNKNILSYGYSPDFNVWIKFTLQNTTNHPINKILEYDNSLTTNIEFYNNHTLVKKEGFYETPKDRKTLNPIFVIELQPGESNIFYIKASSAITTLIVKLKLYNYHAFYHKEVQNQVILALFFGAMLILGIYNLFIFFYTKDISYLFYVLYIFGIITHHMVYVGVANTYILNQQWSVYFIEYASLLVSFPIYALALFTKSFLHLKQYKAINNSMNIILIIFPLIVLLFIVTTEFSHYRNIFTLLLLIYLVIITTYAAIKKNRQAYFILLGWFIILFAGTSMYISSIGVFDIYQYVPHIVEIGFVLEAIIFSIALADRIKQLEYDKNKVHAQLLEQQYNEKAKLAIKVDEKTFSLKNALDEKEMLLKELNHRVKNNMQTIVSLIRLQLDEIDDEQSHKILTTTYNRISAMSHLHELLYQDDLIDIDAKDYFRLLTDDIKESYSENIKLHFNITSELKIDQAIYCGLILNELITNAFKYAFTHSTNGNIYIKLSKNTTHYFLSVKDDGVGYDKDTSSNSLGLLLVNSLIQSKLKGTIHTNSSNGVEIKITWENTYE